MLGRGAYGLAVAVINRLDGRQYAVKKIRLQRQVPSEYARITREVATLSRLQHTNIVRYFQVDTRHKSSSWASSQTLRKRSMASSAKKASHPCSSKSPSLLPATGHSSPHSCPALHQLLTYTPSYFKIPSDADVTLGPKNSQLQDLLK